MPKMAEAYETHEASNGAARARRSVQDSLVRAVDELAYNLRWSWDPATVELFHGLAADAWDRGHNPLHVLRAIGGDLHALAARADEIEERRTDLHRYLRRPQ